MIRKEFEELRAKSSEWEQLWQRVSDSFNVISYPISAYSKQKPKINQIYDNTALISVNAIVSGLQSGITPASRKWFKLSSGDSSFANSRELSRFEDFVDRAISITNVYSTLPEIYRDVVLYGFSVSYIEEDSTDIFRIVKIKPGSVFIDVDLSGRPIKMLRHFYIKASELKSRFGVNINEVNNNELSVYHSVHFDENTKEWVSTYEHAGEVVEKTSTLFCPFLFVRWNYNSETPYPVSPAMNALGDVNQLQVEQQRKGEAIDFQSKPPVQIPIGMRNSELNFRPGGIMYYNSNDMQIRPATTSTMQINYLIQDIEDVRSRIRAAFFHDVFAMMTNIDHTGMTATEVQERRAEKMLILGSVIDRMQDDFVEPFLKAVILIISKSKYALSIPDMIPDFVKNGEFDIIPVGSLYQSRLESNNNDINRFIGQVMTLSQIDPRAFMRIDIDKTIEMMAKNSGINTSILLTKEEVDEKIKEEEEKAMQKEAFSASLSNPQSLAMSNSPNDAQAVIGSLGEMGVFNE